MNKNTTSKRNYSHCVGMWTKGLGDALFIIRKVNFFTGNFKGSDFYLDVRKKMRGFKVISQPWLGL